MTKASKAKSLAMARPVVDEPAASHRIEDALDEIARLAGLAASYWHSVELAADRGDC